MMYSGSRLMGSQERSYWPSFPYLRYLAVICPDTPGAGCWLVCHCSSCQIKEDFQSKLVKSYRFSRSIMSCCFPPSDLWVVFLTEVIDISKLSLCCYTSTLKFYSNCCLSTESMFFVNPFLFHSPNTAEKYRQVMYQRQLKHRHHFNTMKLGCLSVATVDAWKTSEFTC